MRYLLAFQRCALLPRNEIHRDHSTSLDFAMGTRHLYRRPGNQVDDLLRVTP